MYYVCAFNRWIYLSLEATRNIIKIFFNKILNGDIFHKELILKLLYRNILKLY